MTMDSGQIALSVGWGMTTDVDTSFSNFDLGNHDYVVYCTLTPVDYIDPWWNSYLEIFV